MKDLGLLSENFLSGWTWRKFQICGFQVIFHWFSINEISPLCLSRKSQSIFGSSSLWGRFPPTQAEKWLRDLMDGLCAHSSTQWPSCLASLFVSKLAFWVKWGWWRWRNSLEISGISQQNWGRCSTHWRRCDFRLQRWIYGSTAEEMIPGRFRSQGEPFSRRWQDDERFTCAYVWRNPPLQPQIDNTIFVIFSQLPEENGLKWPALFQQQL